MVKEMDATMYCFLNKHVHVLLDSLSSLSKP